MTSERIKEIQEETGFPNSTGIYLALMKVWNECMQERPKDLISKEDAVGFAIWIDHSRYTYVGGQWTDGISKQSSEQLYNQYQQTK